MTHGCWSYSPRVCLLSPILNQNRTVTNHIFNGWRGGRRTPKLPVPCETWRMENVLMWRNSRAETSFNLKKKKNNNYDSRISFYTYKQSTWFTFSSSVLEFGPISLAIVYHRLAQDLFVFLPNFVSFFLPFDPKFLFILASGLHLVDTGRTKSFSPGGDQINTRKNKKK